MDQTAGEHAAVYFATPEELRAWLAAHHAEAGELWVGYYKKGSGRPSITWPESVDEALCYGWIDGLRRTVDGERYRIRFTPRRPRSIWSAVNIRRVAALAAEGRMQPAGMAVFERRRDDASAIYSHEQGQAAELGEAYERELRATPGAWEFFQAQPPSYRRGAAHWVMSARQEATRRRRLATLVEDSAAGRRLKMLSRP